MKNFIKLAYCLMIMGLSSYCYAQEVSVSVLGQGDRILCNNYNYKVGTFVLPTTDADAQIIGYQFYTPLGGNLYYNRPNAGADIFFTSNEIAVMWNLPNMQQVNSTYYKGRLKMTVNCIIKWHEPERNTDGTIKKVNGYTVWKGDKTINAAAIEQIVKGVTPISITGPSSIQNCAATNQTYQVYGFADANRFVWKVPTGWTVTGAGNSGVSTGTNTFTTTSPYLYVTSNATGSGTVSCAAHLVELEGLGPNCYYEESNSMFVDRNISPSLSIAATNLKPRYCPGSTVVLTATSAAGFTGNFTWNLPTGYTAVYSGANNSIATVTIGSTTGSIMASRMSCVGSLTSNAVTTQIYSATLPAPVFSIDAIRETYHCGRYNASPDKGGEIEISNHLPEAGTITWTKNRTDWSLDVTPDVLPTYAVCRPLSYPGALPCTITVTAKNCVNPIGTSKTIIVYQEPVAYWVTNNYPEGCECCAAPPPPPPPPPGGTGGGVRPRQRVRNEGTVVNETQEIKDFSDIAIYPNPSSGNFTIYFPENNRRCAIDILDINGRIVTQTTADTPQISLNMDEEANGVYIVIIKTETETVYRKIVLSK